MTRAAQTGMNVVTLLAEDVTILILPNRFQLRIVEKARRTGERRHEHTARLVAEARAEALWARLVLLKVLLAPLAAAGERAVSCV